MNTRRAPAVVLASTKGGVGKATVAFRLATALARRLPLARAGLPAVRDAQVTAGLVVIDLEGPANQAMLYACGKADVTGADPRAIRPGLRPAGRGLEAAGC